MQEQPPPSVEMSDDDGSEQRFLSKRRTDVESNSVVKRVKREFDGGKYPINMDQPGTDCEAASGATQSSANSRSGSPSTSSGAWTAINTINAKQSKAEIGKRNFRF